MFSPEIVYYLNVLVMLATIGLGMAGWLAPRWTMELLDLRTEGTKMGVSEVRAASGALFIGLGLSALIINQPLGYAMVGFAYAGAATGRLTSIVIDRPETRNAVLFFITEAVIALWLIFANLL
jgi:hypothetical protein